MSLRLGPRGLRAAQNHNGLQHLLDEGGRLAVRLDLRDVLLVEGLQSLNTATTQNQLKR